MLSPWLIVAALLAVAGAGYTGFELGRDVELATQYRENDAATKAGTAAAEAAARAISGLKVNHVTIRQRTDTITREVPVYRDCVHDDRVFDAINEARTGQGAAAGQLPAASAAGR